MKVIQWIGEEAQAVVPHERQATMERCLPERLRSEHGSRSGPE